jgi:hypothetical protein
VDLNVTVTDAIVAIGVALIGWLGHRFLKPKDHQRAALLAAIARGAAALVISLNPTAKWAELLKQVVDRILSAPSVPTRSKDAIERAAAAALADLGKAPGAP